MDDDQILVNCPHCQALLTVDDAGDLAVVDAPPAEGVEGLGGLRVVHAAGDDWAKQNYIFNNQDRKKALADGKKLFGMEHRLGAQPDPALEAANSKDLREKNIPAPKPKRTRKPKQTEHNDNND